MIRKMLELRMGKMSNQQFQTVMENATDDIKFNRIKFKKTTYLENVLEIAEQCIKIDRRIKKGDSESHQTQPHYIRDGHKKATKFKENILSSESLENTQAI